MTKNQRAALAALQDHPGGLHSRLWLAAEMRLRGVERLGLRGAERAAQKLQELGYVEPGTTPFGLSGFRVTEAGAAVRLRRG